ncbi:hypothetical protein WJX82_008844 [Trebouxia sp. C0006]
MSALSAPRFSCGGSRLHSQRAGRPKIAAARRCVHVRAELKEGKVELHKAGTSLLAIAIWTGVTFAAPQVQHLNAYADDNNTSAYNKRLADTQKRRELLTQARKNALAKGGQAKAIESGEAEDPEVAAANREVEATNAKRAQESERSLQALRQKAADDYTKQSSKTGPAFKRVSYTLSDDSSSAPAFDFSDPPPALDTPQDPTPTPEINPGSVMNSSSSSPFPSALAPSQPRQQEGLADGLDTPDPFKGLFDLPKTELAPGKAPAQGPSSSFQDGEPTATMPPTRAAKALVQEPAIQEPAIQEPAKQVAAVIKSNKRQGPLPLFLAQFLVLAAYGGFGFLAFKKDEETRKAVAFVLGAFRKGYNKLQQVLPSGSKA